MDDPLERLPAGSPERIAADYAIWSMQNETDRGCALVAAEIVNEGLLILLSTSFLVQRNDAPAATREIFETNAPLATFSARAELALVIGLISVPTSRDIRLLRKIRNEFAHVAAPASFSDDAIAPRLREFLGSEQYDLVAGKLNVHTGRPATRMAFMFKTAELYSRLSRTTRSAEAAGGLWRVAASWVPAV